MSKIRAVTVDPTVPGGLALNDVDLSTPAPNEALIRVAAVSLNRGEVRRSTTAEAGWQPGWDLAGIVETPAADGSSPSAGTRVVGFVRSGAWAELVADGQLHPHIAVEAPWTQVADLAQQLIDRRFLGKAVLHVFEGKG